MSHQPGPSKKEVEHVSTRVLTTKKEIEVLKAQLESLINSGTQLNQPKQTIPDVREPAPLPQGSVISKENVVTTQRKPELSKENSPRKNRNYNVAEAREYMKKQREKRAEQLKAKVTVTDNTTDLKKQKLRELQQKTRELVEKNLELKRARSKSRDKGEPLRLDKANPRQRSQDRFKSQERINNKENINKPHPNYAEERQKSKSRERTQSLDRNQPGPSQQKSEVSSNSRSSRPRARRIVENDKKSPLASFDTNYLNPPHADLNQDNHYKTFFPQNDEVNRKKEEPKATNKKPNFAQESRGRTQSQDRTKPGPSQPKPESSSSSRFSRPRMRKIVEIDKKSPLASFGVKNIDTNFLYPPNVNLNHDNLDKTFFPQNDELNQKNEVLTDACLRDTKETQTSKKSNFEEPVWLQPPAALPYPYNFINTVKRKLQYAINSPRSCVDAAVQLPSDIPTPEPPKSREEIKEILKSTTSSKVKSFASHKCPNLDLKVVENLELRKEKLPKNLFADYDSESDTSKNIPEISSESLLSSDKLSLDRVKNLKLNKPGSSGVSSVKTDTNGYPGKDTYSSDFLKESTVKSGKTSVDEPSVSTNRQSSKVSSESTVAEESGHVPSVSTKRDSSRVSSESTESITTVNNSIVATENLLRTRKSNEDPSLKSLMTEGQLSKSTLDSFQAVPLALKEPTVSLSYKGDLAKSQMKNITLRPTAQNKVNEIHLKFEAEVRLLNDVNEIRRQFMTVENEFENLKNQKDVSMTKVLQNVDTQTSVVAKSSTSSKQRSSINYSRGSDVEDDSVLSDSKVNGNLSVQNSTFSMEMNFSNLNVSGNSTISMDNDNENKFSLSNIENYDVKDCAGLSLNMFEQLIRDEDAKIQHLKTIIKIREQALRDRTKTELVCLEIQKKQLIETGKIEEASLLKKKQRGVILKHEQERNEIKKLKQMQKKASEERKNILKHQRNLIKSQLSTNKMLSKIKVKTTPKERRSSFGPLKVVQSCSESIHSETSISMKSLMGEDVLSVTSHSIRVSELESEVELAKEKLPISNVKRTLFMREAALQKRRKTAEELLRWHRKLLEEEKKIAELEAAATSVIKRMPAPANDKYTFNGQQLNQLWRNMTGRDDRKFVEDKVYVMSQVALERLCKSARQSATSKRKRNSDASTNYSSIFDPESIINSQEEKTKISSSISELIDNFSRIEDEISFISKKSELDITSLNEVEEESEKTVEESSHSSVVKTMTPNHVSEPEHEIEEVVEEKIEQDNQNDISSSPKETVVVSTPTIEEITPEEVTSPEKTDTKHESSEEKEPAVTESEVLERDSSVITAESEEKSSEPVSESKDTKLEPSSVVTSEAVEDPQEEESTEKLETIEKSIATVISEAVEDPEESEELETIEKSLETEESNKEATTDEEPKEESSPKDTEEIETSAKEALSLDEALQCASKIEESLIKLNKQLADENKEEISEVSEVTPPRKITDVKKRVSEILADANAPRPGDKSPRLQDLYITAYDVGSLNSPELNEDGRPLPTDIFGTEAEELWKKQLAIEQEIKQLELQQQKEQIPYVFMREIPNKPPPPYTPPSSQSSQSVLPMEVKQINEISDYSSKVLHKAFLNNNLDKVKFSENGFKLFSKVEVTKICAEFVFNICKDIAKDHYKQFDKVEEPSWLMVEKKTQLAKTKPLDSAGLDKLMNTRLKELFGFKKTHTTESAIIKWGRKKRDHVDEILVIESQEEESQWTNFDMDELIVKDRLTNDIMKMLIDETAMVFGKILVKK